GDVHRASGRGPASRKGSGGGRGGDVGVPLMPALAALLRKAAAGRPANAPLLTRADGAAWQPRIADHREAFVRAAKAANLPAGTTIYSLRDSIIHRELLHN